MAITKYDPWSSFPSLRGPWFDEDFFRRSTDQNGLDVYETDNEVVVEAALPGLTESEVDVTYEDGILRIQGQKQEREDAKKNKKAVYRETSFVSFDYTITLPRAVDSEKITAEVENGIVKVVAPIAAESKPRKIKAVNKSSK